MNKITKKQLKKLIENSLGTTTGTKSTTGPETTPTDAVDENPVKANDQVTAATVGAKPPSAQPGQMFDAPAKDDGTNAIEEALRSQIRSILKETLIDPNADDESKRYEEIAAMLAKDVAERTREEVKAGHFDFKDDMPKNISISGTKQYTDRLGFKVRYLRDMDSRPMEGEPGVSELQAFLEEMVEEYIDLLNSSGVLTPQEVNELQQNPDIISNSPNFRRFLGGKVAGLPASWPDTTMPDFKTWVQDTYSAQTAQNKVDSALKAKRAADKPDT